MSAIKTAMMQARTQNLIGKLELKKLENGYKGSIDKTLERAEALAQKLNQKINCAIKDSFTRSV